MLQGDKPQNKCPRSKPKRLKPRQQQPFKRRMQADPWRVGHRWRGCWRPRVLTLCVGLLYDATSKWKTFAVQVEALAMITYLHAGDSGVNAHAVPSFFLAAALGTGSVGAMLKCFASQVRRGNTHDRGDAGERNTPSRHCSDGTEVVR